MPTQDQLLHNEYRRGFRRGYSYALADMLLLLQEGGDPQAHHRRLMEYVTSELARWQAEFDPNIDTPPPPAIR